MLPGKLRDFARDLFLFRRRHEDRFDADAGIRIPNARLAGHAAQIVFFYLAVRVALRPMLRHDTSPAKLLQNLYMQGYGLRSLFHLGEQDSTSWVKNRFHFWTLIVVGILADMSNITGISAKSSAATRP